LLGAQQNFTATVTGTSNTAVTWSVNGVAGGNATVGTITAQGQYTAPRSLPANAQVTITAASQASAGAAGSATVTLTSDIVVNVSAGSLNVELGAQQQFTATIQSAGNPITAVMWSVSGTGCSGAACGTIDTTTGLYTAPQILPSPASVTVRATSQADASKSGTATATVTATFTINATGPSQIDNATSSVFQATVTPAPNSSPDMSVNWSVAAAPGGACTGAGTGLHQCGTIDALGNFTAATVAPPSPGNVVRVTATSVADPSKSAFVDVVINTVIIVVLSPSSASVELETSQQFTATVGGTTNQNVIWDVDGVVGGNSTVGTITNPGSGPATYSAPVNLPSPASATITARWDDPAATAQNRASVSVQLFSTISIVLSANSTVRAINRRLNITGVITRQGGVAPANKAVTWRVNGIAGGNTTVGQICLPEGNRTSTNCFANTVSDADILGGVDYVAPANVPSPATVTIEAVSQADPSRSGSFQVTVQATVTVSVSPINSTLPTNQRQVFTAAVLGSDINTVNWEVEGVANGDSTFGQICVVGSNPCTKPTAPTNQVEYLAPGSTPANPPVDLRAISTDDPLQSAAATVSVQTGPFITSLQPASITAGPANSFTLRVRGSNFDSGASSAQIIFDGTGLTTTCTSSTECTATVATTDVATAGNKSVQIQNPVGAPCSPACPGLSNAVNLIVVAPATTETIITLDPNNPVASGQDIEVVEPTTAGTTGALQVNATTIGVVIPGVCSSRNTPISIPRPASGSLDVQICISGPFVGPQLQTNFNYSISGPSPADITISNVRLFGGASGIIEMTLTVPSTAQTGPRTIFVENLQKEKSALVGAVDIK
jgi:hypothetical protein